MNKIMKKFLSGFLSVSICLTFLCVQTDASEPNMVVTESLHTVVNLGTAESFSSETRLFTQDHPTDDGYDYNTVCLIKMDLSELEEISCDVINAKFKVSPYIDVNWTFKMSVYATSYTSWTDKSNVNADEMNAAGRTLLGTKTLDGTGTTNVEITLDTDELFEVSDDYGIVTLILTAERPGKMYPADGSIPQCIIYDSKQSQIEFIVDQAPVATCYSIVGSSIENFELSAKYEYSSVYYPQGDTLIQWFRADNTLKENPELIGSGKSVELSSVDIGKYIFARITPYANDGKYVAGGEGIPNSYDTDCVGPVRPAAYLNELASVADEIADSSLLETYLMNNENVLKLGINEIDDEEEKTQILENLVFADISTYELLLSCYNIEKLTFKINRASSENVKELIEDDVLDIDLTEYNKSDFKEDICSCIVTEEIRGYKYLQTALNRSILFAEVKNGMDANRIASFLNEYAELLTINTEDYSYGELLSAGSYIVENDRSDIESFSELDNFIAEAYEEGKNNYLGGYISVKLDLFEPVYIKADYSGGQNGIHSILSVDTASYKLFANMNAGNYKQFVFFKVDLSSLPEYAVYNSTFNLFATSGGGANKKLAVYSFDDYDNPDEFIEKYPTNSELSFGDELGYGTFSYGTEKWANISITDYISQSVLEGKDIACFGLVYENEEGTATSNPGYVCSLKDETYAPYIEVVLETPPIAKNINIKGTKTVGSTIKAEYDYYGCNEEYGTGFEWYCADKTGDTYSNVQKIPEETKDTLLITEELSEKCIMVKIKPCAKEGYYRTGELTSSEYTVPILDVAESIALKDSINNALTTEELKSILEKETYMEILDVDLALDMSLLKQDSSGETAVLTCLVNREFASVEDFANYYNRMINVQYLNEAEETAVDEILLNKELGIKTDRYDDYEDKSDVISAVWNKSFANLEEFQEAFNEACAIKEFSAVTHENVQELLLWYDFMFEENIASYDSAQSKLTILCNNFMTAIQGKSSTFEGIAGAVTAAVNAANNYKPSIDVGDGTGNTGSRDNTVSVPPASVNPELTPVQTKSKFKDIDNVESWAGEAINELSKEGIISGDGNGNFRPNDSVTREEFIKLIVEAFEIDGISNIKFNDVDEDAWYYEYVNKAVSAGIVRGVSEDTFGTGADITRQDMCVMLYRAMVHKLNIEEHGAELTYRDKDDISSYAYKAVLVLNNMGIVNGLGDDTFAPLNNTTRAQAAVVIHRAKNYK